MSHLKDGRQCASRRERTTGIVRCSRIGSCGQLAFQATSARWTDRVSSRAYQFAGVSRSIDASIAGGNDAVTNSTLNYVILTLAVLVMATAFAVAPGLTSADLLADHIGYMSC